MPKDRKRRKVKIGYCLKDWEGFFIYLRASGSPARLAVPIILSRSALWKRLDKDYARVRITIEDLPHAL